MSGQPTTEVAKVGVASQILTLLSDRMPRTSSELVAASTHSNARTVRNILARLARDTRVSTVKPEKQVMRYFMTDNQVKRHQGLISQRPTSEVPLARLGRELSAIEISARLRFLDSLAARPAFLGDARLAEIIDDYRRALKRDIHKQQDEDHESATA